MKSKIFTAIFFIIIAVSCNNNSKKKDQLDINDKASLTSNRLDKILKTLNDPNSKHVMVISHRGDWRNAPENSIQAIKNCIKMGVDMVEIDVRKTKDNKLIVMHDAKLNRTTTGKGYVSDWSLDSINKLRLKNGTGRPTHHKIPTLKEALLTAKGKILINLDKCYDYFDEAFKIIQETGTASQVVIKGYRKTVEDVKNDFGNRLDSIVFMPIVHLDKQSNAKKIIKDYQSKLNPVAFEIVFSKDTSEVINKFSEIKMKGSKVWVNSLWKSLNAGYEDDIALNKTDSIYGWYINKGVNMIQTDRPQLLLSFLRNRKLHD